MIESPNATMAPASLPASTSTASRKNHCRTVVGNAVPSTSPVKFPAVDRYPVAACGCDVLGGVSAGRYRVTTRSLRDGSASGTGSLVAVDPAGMLTAGWPPKVSVRAVSGRMRAPVSRVPIVAAPISSGAAPHPFVSLTRTPSPPRLVWTTIRRDWLLNRVEAGSPSSVAGPKHSGLVLQVPTQCSCGSEYATKPPSGEAGGAKNQNPWPAYSVPPTIENPPAMPPPGWSLQS